MAKIYTQTYDISQPTEQRFWVAPFSTFKIGVKVVDKGEEVQGALSLKNGSTALSAEATEIDGFTIFPASSTSAGSTLYTLSAEGVPETMKLIQVTTGSTVFEVDEAGDGGGGDMSNYYTKSETSSAVEIGTALEGKQPTGDYALTSQIPTVNDGTLTILQGGVQKGTFTANQSTDISIDLAAGGGGASSYSILTVQLEDGKYALQNQSVNNITLLSGTTSALMEFPLSSAGTARDFFVRLNVEDATGLSVYWQEPDGSTPSFDAANDAWNDIETGVNVMMFMETAQ